MEMDVSWIVNGVIVECVANPDGDIDNYDDKVGQLWKIDINIEYEYSNTIPCSKVNDPTNIYHFFYGEIERTFKAIVYEASLKEEELEQDERTEI